jgi:hypothetical protein
MGTKLARRNPGLPCTRERPKVICIASPTPWTRVGRRGSEDLVAKDSASPYVGRRTLKWLKVKQAKYREGERGWEPTKK